MRILISNDDGVFADGIRVLGNYLKKKHKVTVVAPMDEQSTMGHSLTLHKPLRIKKIEKDVYGVSGTPADSIYLGLKEVMKKNPPDVVISGINHGANLGQDVYYSGTVAAAREAAISGIPSFAVSLVVSWKKGVPSQACHFKSAAIAMDELLKDFSEVEMPRYTLMNVNVPDLPYGKIKGFQVCEQGHRIYGGKVVQRMDHRGRPYYWVGGTLKGDKVNLNSDSNATNAGYISLTPHKLNSTDHNFLKQLTRLWPEYDQLNLKQSKKKTKGRSAPGAGAR